MSTYKDDMFMFRHVLSCKLCLATTRNIVGSRPVHEVIIDSHWGLNND